MKNNEFKNGDKVYCFYDADHPAYSSIKEFTVVCDAPDRFGQILIEYVDGDRRTSFRKSPYDLYGSKLEILEEKLSWVKTGQAELQLEAVKLLAEIKKLKDEQ